MFNFRDLGGHKTKDGRTVRWRKLFRSDSVHHMTTGDVSYARDLLNIRTVIDLRTPEEVQCQGIGALVVPPVARHHFSLTNSTAEMDDIQPYIRILNTSGLNLAEAFNVLANTETYPAVFCCNMGKDRTGVLAAVLLGALGVDDEQIMHDYEMTKQSISQNTSRVIEHIQSDYNTLIDDIPPFLARVIDTKPQAIKAALINLRDEYGSIRDYVRSIGVTEDALVRLEQALLTK